MEKPRIGDHTDPGYKGYCAPDLELGSFHWLLNVFGLKRVYTWVIVSLEKGFSDIPTPAAQIFNRFALPFLLTSLIAKELAYVKPG